MHHIVGASDIRQALTGFAAGDVSKQLPWSAVGAWNLAFNAFICLLGGELIEADADGLEVIIFVNEVGVPFPASLARELDEVKTGLLDDYVDDVIRGVARVAE